MELATNAAPTAATSAHSGRVAATERMLEALGAPGVGDRKIPGRAGDLDQRCGNARPAAATFVRGRGAVRGSGLLLRILQPSLQQREPRELGRDARRDVQPRG